MHSITRTAAVTLAAAATVAILAGCGSTSAAPAGAATSAPPTSASPSPTAPATAPDSSTCQAFAQVYNGQLGPLLATPNAGGDVNVYFTQLGDAFTALAGSLSSATDPYSQTIVKDAEAIAADPSSLTAMGTFNTDLPVFLKQCGMGSGS